MPTTPEREAVIRIEPPVSSGRHIDLAKGDQRARAGRRPWPVYGPSARVVTGPDVLVAAPPEKEKYSQPICDDLGAGVSAA